MRSPISRTLDALRLLCIRMGRNLSWLSDAFSRNLFKNESCSHILFDTSPYDVIFYHPSFQSHIIFSYFCSHQSYLSSLLFFRSLWQFYQIGFFIPFNKVIFVLIRLNGFLTVNEFIPESTSYYSWKHSAKIGYKHVPEWLIIKPIQLLIQKL